MKIESNLLKEFIEKIYIEGRVMDCKLNFDIDGIKANVITKDNIGLVLSQMSKSCFINYKPTGIIGIQDVGEFIEFLGRFGNEIVQLSLEGNVLKLSSDVREGEYILPDLQFIKDVEKLPSLQYNESIKIDVKHFVNAFNNAGVLIKKGEKFINIKVKDGKLILGVGEDHKLREIIKTSLKEEVNVSFGEVLGSIAKLLDGEIDVNIKTNYPITIIKNNDKYKLKYVVAPIVENE